MPFQKGHIGYWTGKVGPRKNISLSEETKQKIRKTLKGNIPWNKGKKEIYSEETRKKMSESAMGRIPWNKGVICLQISEANKGSKHHNWKGGISSFSMQIRNHYKSRQWRSDVLTRDDFTCQECGSRDCKLDTHHIESFNSIMQKYEITTLEEALNCEELWNINNGITLCKKCHRRIDKKDEI